MERQNAIATSPAYVWGVPGKPRIVHLSLDVVDRLGTLASQSFARGDHPSEIGGLLLGTVPPGDAPIVTVEDFRLVPCEHIRGTAYALSEKDRKVLADTLRRHHWDARLTPVGFWRTHARPGLYLDQDDFAVARDHFGDPPQVTLLISPGPQGLSAGFFIWEEDGDMHRQSTYLRFPFDRALLASGSHPLIDRPVAAPALSVGAPPAVVSTPAPAQPSGFTFPRPARLLPWAAAAVLAAVMAVIPFAVGRHSRPGAGRVPAPLLSLGVARAGDALRLTWDRGSAPVRQATRGVVHITEGSRDYRLDLSPDQLALGTVVYFPTGADVGFRLELQGPSGSLSEFIRAVAPAPSLNLHAPPPGLPLASALDPLPPSPPPPQPRRVRAARRARPRPLDLAALERSASPPPAPRAVLEPPPHLPPLSAAAPPPAPVAFERPREATVTIGPAKPSALNRFIRRIPGLRRLQGASTRGFVPPRPIRRVQPSIPAPLRGTDAPVAVDLKIRIDETGNVLRTELLSGDPREFAARQALGAARKWQFAPAELDGKPVPSEMVLHFKFGG